MLSRSLSLCRSPVLIRSLLSAFPHRRSMSASDSASPPKQARTGPLTIGTHDGMFHCDEALGCFLLRQLPQYADARIVRSRQPARLATCDIVIDVGGEFDAERHRYDHHQRSFEHTLSSLRPELGDQWTVKLSSAGLVYAHFGERVVERVLRAHGAAAVADDSAALRVIYLKTYASLIREVDGIDNGVPQFPADVQPAYEVGSHLSNRVRQLNARWNADRASFDEQAAFERAQSMAGEEFVDRVLYYATSWWPARAVVERALRQRHQVHASGEILELDCLCPWKEHLFELEAELGLEGEAKYVLFASAPGDHRVMGVPLSPASFLGRKFLHAKWRGVRDAQLAEVSGVPGAKFVHAAGFIGGAETREASLQMAVLSLAAPE